MLQHAKPRNGIEPDHEHCQTDQQSDPHSAAEGIFVHPVVVFFHRPGAIRPKDNFNACGRGQRPEGNATEVVMCVEMNALATPFN